MKKIPIITVLTLFLISNDFFSQRCYYDYNKIDPISNEKVQRIDRYCNKHITISFYKKGNNYRIQGLLTMDGEQNFIQETGAKIDLKLTTGKILTLKTETKSTPTTQINKFKNGVGTYYNMSYLISKGELNEIQTNGIIFVRIYVKDNTEYFDCSMNKLETRETKKSAGCIIN